jgi:hypothetical protein
MKPKKRMTKKRMTESQMFRSKIYKAFPNAPKRLVETGSGYAFATGERDYGFLDKKTGKEYAVVKRRNGTYYVDMYERKVCETCRGYGSFEKRMKKVIR